MPLRRFFDTDHFGEAIDPDQWYVVDVRPRGKTSHGKPYLPVTEYVSGEDLLACADFVDQLITERKDDDNT